MYFLVDKEETDTTVTEDEGNEASDMEVVEEPGDKEEELHVEEEDYFNILIN